jgi:hypothetical protein
MEAICSSETSTDFQRTTWCYVLEESTLQEDALLSLFFNLAFEYAVRKSQEKQAGLKLNWTYQLLVYADDVNLQGNNTDTIKKTQKL